MDLIPQGQPTFVDVVGFFSLQPKTMTRSKQNDNLIFITQLTNPQGFPQHLYIPKGHVGCMTFDLFVMVTDYDIDFVPNSPRDLEIPETCNSPYIFCGLPRRRYPDSRPLGYPFDRPLFRSLNCPPGWTFFSVLCQTVNMIINNPIDNFGAVRVQSSEYGYAQSTCLTKIIK